jgi:hypothetical protein
MRENDAEHFWHLAVTINKEDIDFLNEKSALA